MTSNFEWQSIVDNGVELHVLDKRSWKAFDCMILAYGLSLLNFGSHVGLSDSGFSSTRLMIEQLSTFF